MQPHCSVSQPSSILSFILTLSFSLLSQFWSFLQFNSISTLSLSRNRNRAANLGRRHRNLASDTAAAMAELPENRRRSSSSSSSSSNLSVRVERGAGNGSTSKDGVVEESSDAVNANGSSSSASGYYNSLSLSHSLSHILDKAICV